jgi:hypothetical protein
LAQKIADFVFFGCCWGDRFGHRMILGGREHGQINPNHSCQTKLPK